MVGHRSSTDERRVPPAGPTIRGSVVEFRVEFAPTVPGGTPEAEVTNRERAETAAAAKLVGGKRLARWWKGSLATRQTNTIGFYRADSQTELEGWLKALPRYAWMNVG
jgi:muconolactone delta-isomerase